MKISMDVVEISKVLSNPTRVQILQWLKTPEAHFPYQHLRQGFQDGVCVQYIAAKSELSISTISHYLSTMQKADLVITSRFGKYTYYRRNEVAIAKFIALLQEKL